MRFRVLLVALVLASVATVVALATAGHQRAGVPADAVQIRSTPTLRVIAGGDGVSGSNRFEGSVDAPTVGAVVMSSSGTWTHSPTRFAYRWRRCAGAATCSAIPGANGRTYTVAARDLGETLKVVVTASNAKTSGTAASEPTGAVIAAGSAVNAAPTLTVDVATHTISWPADAGSTGWQGAVSDGPRSVSRRTTRYVDDLTSAGATSWTPPTECGRTDYYGVASEGPAGHRWSTNEIAITWPSCPVHDGRALQVGVMNAECWGVNSIIRSLGVTDQRLDVGNGEGSNWTTCSSGGADVPQAVRDGFQVLVVYDPGNWSGLSTATVEADMANLKARMHSLGLTQLEFGNEVWLPYEGADPVSTYASQYNAAHAALAGSGITLIADATTATHSCNARGSSDTDWIAKMVADMPGGAREIDAWSLHPYGPVTEAISGRTTDTCTDSRIGSPNGGYGWDNVWFAHRLAIAAGSDAPWFITEVGQCLAGCQVPVAGPSEQAAALTRYLDDLIEPTSDPGTPYTWVKGLYWYSSCDDGTGRYGLLGLGVDGALPGCRTTRSTYRPAADALEAWIRTHGDA